MENRFLSHADTETQSWGESFGKSLPSGAVVAFYGPMGVGKTTLIKAIIDGITNKKMNPIHSPTYVYLNEYRSKDKIISHFDLYRLRECDDFVECGFEEYLYRDGICLIEWAERIEKLLPSHSIRLRMEHIDQMTREITWAT